VLVPLLLVSGDFVLSLKLRLTLRWPPVLLLRTWECLWLFQLVVIGWWLLRVEVVVLVVIAVFVMQVFVDVCDVGGSSVCCSGASGGLSVNFAASFTTIY